MDPFLTTYRKHYVPKNATRPPKNGIQVEFRDPIQISFQDYLQVSGTEPALETPVEYGDGYLEKHGEKYPKHIQNFFETPLNNEVIKKSIVENGQTVYQVDFCDLEQEIALLEDQKIKEKEFVLPDGWEIAETTHKYWFRKPVDINPQAMIRARPIRGPNNLDPNDKIRRILKVTTGDTEYGGVISALGNTIMDDELLGKVVHPQCGCQEHHPKQEDNA